MFLPRAEAYRYQGYDSEKVVYFFSNLVDAVGNYLAQRDLYRIRAAYDLDGIDVLRAARSGGELIGYMYSCAQYEEAQAVSQH